ncbi:hypothetical protein L5515_018620 [Caenorhabditis briggsae]|uniref:Uncharacterized protein n=1 Tax=Caenorhabditis briggsae TaxID=6238 RepID=A0AAE9FCS3_CAEBR|nr:hypothetical protein L5515_018620 [Caenorhabditis briggsae]
MIFFLLFLCFRIILAVDVEPTEIPVVFDLHLNISIQLNETEFSLFKSKGETVSSPQEAAINTARAVTWFSDKTVIIVAICVFLFVIILSNEFDLILTAVDWKLGRCFRKSKPSPGETV